MLAVLLAIVLQLPTGSAQRPAPNAMPPSTIDDPIYVLAPVTIEIANMSAQAVTDLVAAGKIAIDGANHLNIPGGGSPPRIGPDLLRPGVRATNRPKSSADEPIRPPTGQPLVINAPEKLAIVSAGKLRMVVRGNRLVLTEIK